MQLEHKGWKIEFEYGYFTAIGPNYDASWEGDEVGWVDNGERLSARLIPDLYEMIDEFEEERNVSLRPS